MDQRSFLFPPGAAAVPNHHHHSESGAVHYASHSSSGSSSSHGFVTTAPPPAVDMDEQLRGVGLSAAARGGMTMVMLARNEDGTGGGIGGPHHLFGGGGAVYFVQANTAGATGGAPLFFAAPSSSSSSPSSSLQMVPAAVLFQPSLGHNPSSLPFAAAAPMSFMDPGRITTASAVTATFNNPTAPQLFEGPTTSAPAAAAQPPVTATAMGGGGLELLLEASRIQERRSQQQEQEHRVDSPSRDRAWAGSTVPAPAPAAKRKSLPLQSKSRKYVPSIKNLSPPATAPHSLSNSETATKKRKKKDKHKNKKNKKKKSKVVLAKYGIMDVLCGRGGLANRHDGNLVYRKVVDSNKAQYRTLNKRLRGYLAESIVMAIQQAGGRFLEQQNPISKRVAAAERAALEGPNSHVGTSTFVSHRHDLKMADKDVMWVEISFKKAVLKTSQALRETDKSTSGRHSTKAARASVPEEKPRSVIPQGPHPSSPMRAPMHLTPPTPMAPPPSLLPQPTISSKPSESTVVAPEATNVVGKSSTSSRGTDPPRSPAASASASSASSRSLYHDAAQEEAVTSTDKSAKIDTSGRDDHGRPSSVSHKPAERDDDERDDDMAEDEMEDDDEYSSTTSSSISSAASTAPSRSRRSSNTTTAPPRSVVAFVPVASSHLALSQAYLPSVERNKKR